jgi:hypothetical protein
MRVPFCVEESQNRPARTHLWLVRFECVVCALALALIRGCSTFSCALSWLDFTILSWQDENMPYH